MLLHCGGTLGMGVESFELREADVVPRAGGKYRPLGASKYLLDVQEVIPELRDFARLDVEVLMNKDSSEMDGKDWVTLARALHERREEYSAFVVAHGTDTMAYCGERAVVDAGRVRKADRVDGLAAAAVVRAIGRAPKFDRRPDVLLRESKAAAVPVDFAGRWRFVSAASCCAGIARRRRARRCTRRLVHLRIQRSRD